MKNEVYEVPTVEIVELGDTITTNLTMQASGTGMTATYGVTTDVDDFSLS